MIILFTKIINKLLHKLKKFQSTLFLERVTKSIPTKAITDP
jgi:hypothetical protein